MSAYLSDFLRKEMPQSDKTTVFDRFALISLFTISAAIHTFQASPLTVRVSFVSSITWQLFPPWDKSTKVCHSHQVWHFLVGFSIDVRCSFVRFLLVPRSAAAAHWPFPFSVFFRHFPSSCLQASEPSASFAPFSAAETLLRVLSFEAFGRFSISGMRITASIILMNTATKARA